VRVVPRAEELSLRPAFRGHGEYTTLRRAWRLSSVWAPNAESDRLAVAAVSVDRRDQIVRLWTSKKNPPRL
jgi:hypothetical protein